MKKSTLSECKLEVESEKLGINQTIEPSQFNLYEGQPFDIMLHAWLEKVSGSLSPAALGIAWYDWFSHLTISPAKQLILVKKAFDNYSQFAIHIAHHFGLTGLDQLCNCKLEANDSRFADEAWQQYPYNVYSQFFLLCEDWWDSATKDIRGVSQHHEQVQNFVARQLLDMFSPSNFILTNPEVINKTIEENGKNLVDGAHNFIEDYCRTRSDLPPVGTEKFKVGKDVAITPGTVVFRNKLIELIQYKPTTTKVYAEPIFITPAWIMKYYILDLSPHNSLVKYLVSHGHTVFMISWKNPTTDDRNLGMEDYLNLGVLQALDIINQIIPSQRIHAVGYCLGGTLLTIAAATLAEKSDNRLKSMTLFAAEIDFKDSGELSLFIDQSQVTYIEDIMWEKGYLDGKQMSWAFSMLRPIDLIWSRMVYNYLLGKRTKINDLMAWDADTTRMPFRMQSEYLRHLFLNNDLVQGHYKVDDKRIALKDIKVPLFVVGTKKDHISPWHSVYKIHLFTKTDITFVLTNGGHNAGIISEPGHKDRYYHLLLHKKGEAYIGPEQWIEKAPQHDGSWWIAWQEWLAAQSKEKISATAIYPNKKYQICNAPGIYVLQR